MQIQPHEIHLWLACDPQIAGEGLLAHYLALLSEAERAQQARFVFERHRHQYLVTRALLRSTLSLYAPDVDGRSWQFTTNAHGKPAIAAPGNPLTLRFNLSHSEGLIVLAITRDREVGVDVEWPQRSGEMLAIAERYFSPSEVRELFALPPQQRRSRFFDLWTLKEAYIKACGQGLAIPLEEFSYSFPAAGRVGISFAARRQDQPGEWQFWQLAPNADHKVALAIKDRRPYSVTTYRSIPLVRRERVDCRIVRSSHELSRRLEPCL